MEAVARGNPEVLKYRKTWSLSLDNLGNKQRDLGQLDEAGRSYRESLRILDELERVDPDLDPLRQRRAQTMCNVGILERVAGRPTAALRTLREALAASDRIAEPDGGQFYDRACIESQLLALAQTPSSDLLATDRVDCLAAGDRAMAALQAGSRDRLPRHGPAQRRDRPGADPPPSRLPGSAR